MCLGVDALEYKTIVVVEYNCTHAHTYASRQLGAYVRRGKGGERREEARNTNDE